MVWTILKYLGGAAVVILIALWFLGGGVQKIIAMSHFFSGHPITALLAGQSTIGISHLPGAPTFPSIPEVGGGYDAPPEAPPSYGPQSPYAGQVGFSEGAAYAEDPQAQYVQLYSFASDDISLQGWTLQSILTGARASIPEAASPFVMGVVNETRPVVLSPGASATIVSGVSPVGASFEENLCTGYLSRLQSFSPALANRCPQPSDLFPDTKANEQTYGAACVSYAAAVPRCAFPIDLPKTLSDSCRARLGEALSYNGCVARLRADPSFPLDMWRIYLGSRKALWGTEHDVIRLLDAQGRTVGIVKY